MYYFCALIWSALVIMPIMSAHAVIERYQLDTTHTTVMFFIDHDGFSDMVGIVGGVKGTLQLDKENIGKSQLRVTIDPESIRTSSKDLDYLLQGKNFFHSKKYPFIDFSSTKIIRHTDVSAVMQGKLRMREAIAPLRLSITLNKQGKLFGTERLGFSAEGVLKRSDYAMLSYIPQVADEVRVLIETEFIRVD